MTAALLASVGAAPGAARGVGPEAAETAALRRELEGARAALRRQEARCRLLVAALGARLREREEAARAERVLRDRQLAGVLRALTALEARLRQEQRLIRRQLAERDATIGAQAEELRRLRAAQHPEEPEQPERFRWPGEDGACTADDAPAPPRPFALHRGARAPPARGVATPATAAAVSAAAAAAAAAAASARRESEATLLRFRPSVVAAGGAAELDCSALDSDSGVFHGSDGSDSSLRSDEAAAGGGGCCADEEPDDDLPAPARDLAKHYAHNPVLECVSQILLRDRDDAGSPPAQPQPPPPAPGGRRRAPPPPALWPSIREERESLADDADDADAEEAPSPPPPPPAPPARAQHLQERACALLTRRLTVVSHPELEHVDGAMQPPQGSPTPPPSPPPACAPAPPPKAATAPPAVPPKPPQLGALGRLRRRAPARAAAPAPSAAAAAAALARPHRQILSNGSLLKAAAERGGAAGAPAVAVCVQPGSRARGVGPVAQRVQRQLESRPAAIRVGSSVSSLITGAAGGSIVSELARDRHPDALQSHFEEFRLEDVDIGEAEERERAAGDGAAPTPLPVPALQPPAGAAPAPAPAPARDDASSYEGFLEATGLSQKPLLTPSRLLSNHRSVLKPKDVKLRSRAARAAAGVGGPAPAPDRPAPVVRYWVEPFL